GMVRRAHVLHETRELAQVRRIERLGTAERHRQTMGQDRIARGRAREGARVIAPSAHVVFGRDLEKVQVARGVEERLEELPAETQTDALRLHRISPASGRRAAQPGYFFFGSAAQVPAPHDAWAPAGFLGAAGAADEAGLVPGFAAVVVPAFGFVLVSAF